MMLDNLKQRAKQLRLEIYALYLAGKHAGVPWYAKVFIALIIGYALCPIDLIPDFIPVIGYLDDLIIVPAGIMLAIKMIPRPILEECRSRARSEKIPNKMKWIIAAIIAGLWILALLLLFRWLRDSF